MKKNFGIAFVTGRKHFQNVLKTYFRNWIEHDLISNKEISLHLFVVYDVDYSGALASDFRSVPGEISSLLDSVHFYGSGEIDDEKQRLISEGVVDSREADLVFGGGYAGLRNVALHFALQKKMDRLLFIDDDEYPIATVRSGPNELRWIGQSIVKTHFEYSQQADITNGLHCGYISPFPYVSLDEGLRTEDFRLFVEAISNDIISWQNVKRTTIDNFGVTYADEEILDQRTATEVSEVNGMKFISGANLCFNFERSSTPPVFYNPPGARGEDAFMSTMLSTKRVLRVPCYTFHDAFSEYGHVLDGVLPQQLAPVEARSPSVVNRFVKAAIGWVRYKPLLTYVTQRSNYERVIGQAMANLEMTVPRFVEYFGTRKFEEIVPEFQQYHENVSDHFRNLEQTKLAWSRLLPKNRPDFAQVLAAF